jgi:hypothetical protein
MRVAAFVGDSETEYWNAINVTLDSTAALPLLGF